MVIGKEVNERLLFSIPMVTSSCWPKISVSDHCNRLRTAELLHIESIFSSVDSATTTSRAKMHLNNTTYLVQVPYERP